ncbi:hypothetical protein Nepgr_001570 [Nepenthes gracilis]|uniref:DUF7650 domain-containing protein n=1 Tax=Nepenthes gracilis TaxID=150966 RepID=A0AAD3P546_NEPGR|nr:hypothetical protein Nepgr_001570 [Nepenthes gracilis]
MPGVVKSSRRKLLKGVHYFDSVTDVLKKVASEPELVLEAEENRVGSSKEANGWVLAANSEGDGSPDHGCHSYLQPQFTSPESGFTNFTIVHTSLAYRRKASMVRELRSLPVAEECFHRDSVEEPHILLISLTNTLSSSRSKGLSNGHRCIKNRRASSISDPKRKAVSLQTDDGPHQFNRRKNPSHGTLLGPTVKGQGLNACSTAETMGNIVVASVVKQREPNCLLSLPVVDGNVASTEKHLRQNKVSSMKPSIEMNLFRDSLEMETDARLKTQAEDNHSYKNSTDPLIPPDAAEVTFDARRHSKRNRPMTTKALETLESSFLNPEQCNKCLLPCSRDERSKRSRKSGSKSTSSANSGGSDDVKSKENMSNGKHGYHQVFAPKEGYSTQENS